MDDSLKEIIPEFLDETSVYLDIIKEGLLEHDNDQTVTKKIINNLFRTAHSLKGASGLLGFNRIRKVTYRMEDIFSTIRDNQLEISSAIIDALFKGLDSINSLITDLSQYEEETTEIDEVLLLLESLLEKNSERNS